MGLTDEEYARKAALPSLLEELLCHIVSTRPENPMKSIAEWSVGNLDESEKKSLVGTVARGESKKIAIERHDTGFVEVLKTAASAVNVVLGQGNRLGWKEAGRMLKAVQVLKLLLIIDLDIVYSYVDAHYDNVATAHQLHPAAQKVYESASETEILLLHVTRENVPPPGLQRSFDSLRQNYYSHTIHRDCVLSPLSSVPAFALLDLFKDSMQQVHYTTTPFLHFVTGYLSQHRPFSDYRGFVVSFMETFPEDAIVLRNTFRTTAGTYLCILEAEGVL